MKCMFPIAFVTAFLAAGVASLWWSFGVFEWYAAVGVEHIYPAITIPSLMSLLIIVVSIVSDYKNSDTAYFPFVLISTIGGGGIASAWWGMAIFYSFDHCFAILPTSLSLVALAGFVILADIDYRHN